MEQKMSREKQIEEMAIIIYSFLHSDTMSRALASLLHGEGFCRQNKGEWNMNEYPVAQCSVCRIRRNVKTQYGWNFCSNCGAKMEVGD